MSDPDGRASEAGTAVNRLAAELFTRVRGVHGNMVLGPYSVFSVLSLALSGARGVTASELADVTSDRAPDLVRQVNGALADAADGARGFEQDLSAISAESIWTAPGLMIRPDFAALVGPDAVHRTDFARDQVGSATAINSWVSDRTDGRIDNLISPDALSPITLAVLVNAVYFAGPWQKPFHRQEGGLRFTTGTSDVVDADLLVVQQGLAVATGDGWQAVSVPYAGGGVAFTVLLPEAGRFEEIAAGLDGALVERALGGVKEQVSLRMPPLSISTPVELAAPLGALGLRSLFDERSADLSGIAGDPGDLVVSAVVHQALIDLDEHGTVAAAATAMVMRAGAAFRAEPPREFLVDRPFLFVISETTTGAALFIGQVTDPTA